MTILVCVLAFILPAFGKDFMMVMGKVDKVEGNLLYIKPLWCQDRKLILEVEELDSSVKPGDKISFVTELNPCSIDKIKVRRVFLGGRR